MRISYYKVEGIGRTPICQQAIEAAKIKAKETGKPVSVVAYIDNGNTRKLLVTPNGTIDKMWRKSEAEK